MRVRPVASVAFSWLLAVSAASPSPPAKESLQSLWGARLLHAMVIADVTPESTAARAGFKIGDVLESYDRIGLDDAPGFEEFIAGLKSAAGKGAVAVKIRRFEGTEGPPRTLTVELKLPADSNARVGLALHPGVFFLEMLETGAAAHAGIKPWDCIESVEEEGLTERPRLSDFEAHVLTLRNKEGNVRVTVGRWRPTGADTPPKIDLADAREVVLPVPAR